ncbi:hypothetical protein KIN20_010788 [Parelaphostrongylus tenuis]|uniref:Uncharacterized protein n=1 Tax=Parelaphostrongylus tenuis TaxID=148309 RepID=A0AAD5MBY4_PARTN|nr:hypothetical protein KIN20_010788 [Parelaphostrongylus tenuis]
MRTNLLADRLTNVLNIRFRPLNATQKQHRLYLHLLIATVPKKDVHSNWQSVEYMYITAVTKRQLED